MNLSLDEEQQLLRDTARRFTERELDPHARRDLAPARAGFERETWQRFAKNGWLSIPFPKEDGGAGRGLVDLAMLLQELGHGLLVEPLIPTLLAGGVVRRLGSTEQRAEHIGRIVDGACIATLALLEPGGRFALEGAATRAIGGPGEGWQLAGRKTRVWHGAAADLLVVSARVSDEPALFLVDAAAHGVERHSVVTVDGGRAAELRFDGVALDGSALLARGEAAQAALARLTDEACVALGAEALGAMRALHAATLDYVKTRKQFGQAVGTFQAVQHRLVDMFIACEQVDALLIRAAIEADAESPDTSAAASALKVKVGEAGRFVGQQAVQLHGGMGMTDELPVGLHFKRLTAIDAQFGNVDHHLRRYSGLLR